MNIKDCHIEKHIVFFGYHRGSKVNFLGNENYPKISGTYIWAFVQIQKTNIIIIQHPNGFPAKDFCISNENETQDIGIPKGTLDDKLNYLAVEELEIELCNVEEKENRNKAIEKWIKELEKRISK